MTTLDASTDLVRVAPAGAIAQPDYQPERYVAPVVPRLNPLAPGGVETTRPRTFPLSILSLGRKIERKRQDGSVYESPVAVKSTDPQWLVLHEPYGATPGIRQVLAEPGNDFRRLTITFGTEDPFAVRSQMFTRYKNSGTPGSLGMIEAWGDHTELKVIYERDKNGNAYKDAKGKPKPRIFALRPDDPSPDVRKQFAQEVACCQQETRFYFTLARWAVRDGRPFCDLIYPDGYGFYAFRTGSDDIVEMLDASITEVLERTGGRLKDIPLEFEVFFLPRGGPDGVRREVPAVRLKLRPPMGELYSARELKVWIATGLAAGIQLERPRLPSPDQLMLESGGTTALPAGWVVPDMTEEQAYRLQTGERPCNYLLTLRTFMAIIGGTPLADDSGHGWLKEWSTTFFTGRRTLTRRRDIKGLSMVEAAHMIADLSVGLASLRGVDVPDDEEGIADEELAPAPATATAKARSYEEIFPSEEEQDRASDAGAKAAPQRRAARSEFVDAPEALAAARPAEPAPEGEPEESEEELLALANAKPAATSASAIDDEEPSTLIKGPSSPEGQALAALLKEASSLHVPTSAFTVRFPVPRSEIVQKTRALRNLIDSLNEAEDPQRVFKGSKVPAGAAPAAVSRDEDQKDLPF